MSTQATPAGSQDLIAAYKAILRDVLDKRPSGMRQRLAEALGKNRSFITQIANPAYPRRSTFTPSSRPAISRCRKRTGFWKPITARTRGGCFC